MHRRFLLLIGLMAGADVGRRGVGCGRRRRFGAAWSSRTMWRSRMQIPPELNRIEGTLKAWFGYNQFKVIGQSRKTLVTGSEDWLAASKYFSLHVDSKGETRRRLSSEPEIVSGEECASRNGSEIEQGQPAGDQRPAGGRRAIVAGAGRAVDQGGAVSKPPKFGLPQRFERQASAPP